jgi:hypothetical protein
MCEERTKERKKHNYNALQAFHKTAMQAHLNEEQRSHAVAYEKLIEDSLFW